MQKKKERRTEQRLGTLLNRIRSGGPNLNCGKNNFENIIIKWHRLDPLKESLKLMKTSEGGGIRFIAAKE